MVMGFPNALILPPIILYPRMRWCFKEAWVIMRLCSNSRLRAPFPAESVLASSCHISSYNPKVRRLFSSNPTRWSSTTSSLKPYYVTTPIFYVNAEPHIGHLHTIILADIYKRFAELRSNTKSYLCTGTDEHGLKIQRVAEKQGITPKQLCDRVSGTFKDLAKAANVDYSTFMRTTDDRHKDAVKHIWNLLMSKGYLYKSSYSGWYAVSDEAYYPASQVIEGVDPSTNLTQMVSAETGTKVEWMEEENYKFRLSDFRERLIDWLSKESVVQPASRSVTLLQSIHHPSSTDLSDLSVSRPSSRLDWGIRVPGDEDHTIYVWIDALINYLTASGYPWKEEPNKLWPPNLQVVGKDIVRFHSLYLPAVLMALDLPLPTNILVHGHWKMDNEKMSKSRGNVVDPFEVMRKWGTDSVRIYLMHHGGNSAADANYVDTELARFYNKDLRGQLGNLLARSTNEKLIRRLNGCLALHVIPNTVEKDDQKILEGLSELPDIFNSSMEAFEVHRALNAVFSALRTANQHFSELSPWLADRKPDEVHRALFYATETLRIVGILTQAFMPEKSKLLLDALGVHPDRRTWDDLEVGKGGERPPGTAKIHLFPDIGDESSSV